MRYFCAASILAVFLLSAVTNSAVWRVPAEMPSIQSAIDTISAGDTILVSDGLYVEALIGPAFGFTLIGDVEPDTGLYSRPIVDPSSLAMPTTLACLHNLFGEVIIEQFWFRNTAEMFPRQPTDGGGILNTGARLYLRDCVFDSTYRGVISYQQFTSLERCTFIRSVAHCAYVNQTLIARDCVFEVVNNDWAAVLAGDESQIESCQWHGEMGDHDWWLAIGGEGSWSVRQCVFGPGGGSRQELIRLGGYSGLFEDNLIANCLTPGSIMTVNPLCGGQIEVRDNRFSNNIVSGPDFIGNTCISVRTQYDSLFEPCAQNVIKDNIIEFGQGGTIVKGMDITGTHIIRRNKFRDLLPDSQWTVSVSGDPPLFHENIFERNTRSLKSDAGNNGYNAEFNYWGDASGPYHPTLNPLGQGDEVGDSVDFIPWHTDTLFFTNSPEPRPPVPERATLAAYPNPFNTTTTLQLTVPRAGIARIELFDVTGRRVKELWSGAVSDTKEVIWQAGESASGLYFVRAWDPLGNRPLAIAKVVLMK